MTNSIDIPLGVGVIVIKDGKILIGTRTDNGLICGPGGHIQIGEQPSESALRELQEEFNIGANKIYQLGAIQDPEGKWKASMVFLCTDYTGDPKADEDEMTDARFISIDELSKMSNLFPCFAASLKLLLDKIEMHSDGGPGSGNWGHSSVKGVRGGSAPGGGTANRLGTKEGGYTSEAKAWAENKKKNKKTTPSASFKEGINSSDGETVASAIKQATVGSVFTKGMLNGTPKQYIKIDEDNWASLDDGHVIASSKVEKYAQNKPEKFSEGSIDISEDKIKEQVEKINGKDSYYGKKKALDGAETGTTITAEVIPGNPQTYLKLQDSTWSCDGVEYDTDSIACDLMSASKGIGNWSKKISLSDAVEYGSEEEITTAIKDAEVGESMKINGFTWAKANEEGTWISDAGFSATTEEVIGASGAYKLEPASDSFKKQLEEAKSKINTSISSEKELAQTLSELPVGTVYLGDDGFVYIKAADGEWGYGSIHAGPDHTAHSIAEAHEAKVDDEGKETPDAAEKIAKHKQLTKGQALKAYSDTTEKAWAQLDQSDKDALFSYTTGSSFVNEPLHKKQYQGYKDDDGADSIDRITKAIDMCEIKKDTVMHHGVNADGFMAGFGISDTSDATLKSLIADGTIFKDDGFMSCGSGNNTGFEDLEVQMHVLVHKGQKGMFVDQFSAYGDGAGSAEWDGKTTQTSVGKECETILQRGSRCKMLKYYRKLGNLHVYVDLIDQVPEEMTTYGKYCK